jgi:hypothetical protein
MALDYPDIIGEYVTAPQRYEVNGLQYVGLFDPPTINAGETTNFLLYLQNTLDAPIKVVIKLVLPQSGPFMGQPVLRTKQMEIDLGLEMAEVGRLAIPLTTTDKEVSGSYSLGVEVRVDHARGTQAIRHPRPKPVKIPLIDDLSGLNLIGVIGTTYSTRNGRKSSFDITLSKEAGEIDELPSLEPNYQQVWNIELADLMHKAQAEVNESRANIVADLKVEPLFTALYAESTERFADSGLPLRVGEAIAIGKLLTYTVHFFLGQGPLQDGLLCPIWERALANEYATANTMNVLKYAGYRHIVRLAEALSFGLVAQTVGKHLWSIRERQDVGSYVANALDEGHTIPPDFLYLPLMLGALRIITKVKLPDEDLHHTLQLVKKARRERRDILLDADVTRASKIFDHLLNQNMANLKG